jgi:hypothetical protein
MRTLRLLLAVGLSLAPTLAATAAGTTPAFAGGGAGMTLTATMDGQDQRLLVGTKHTVYITLADTPGEADLRDITISLKDLDPHPLPVTCPAGQNGHLSLEPDQSLQCTSVVTAAIGYRTLVARATAYVPSEGPLVRTAPLHYDGFMPPPPPPPRVPVFHTPVAPDPAAGRPPHSPVSLPPPPLNPPDPAGPPDPVVGVGGPGKAPSAPPVRHGCASEAGASDCCSGNETGSSACCGPHSAECCSGHAASSGSRCCGSAAKSADCRTKRGGLAFTGMSTPTLVGAASGGLLLVAGGFVLVRRFAKR